MNAISPQAASHSCAPIGLLSTLTKPGRRVTAPDSSSVLNDGGDRIASDSAKNHCGRYSGTSGCSYFKCPEALIICPLIAPSFHAGHAFSKFGPLRMRPLIGHHGPAILPLWPWGISRPPPHPFFRPRLIVRNRGVLPTTGSGCIQLSGTDDGQPGVLTTI